jgi:hypothetical protein
MCNDEVPIVKNSVTHEAIDECNDFLSKLRRFAFELFE